MEISISGFGVVIGLDIKYRMHYNCRYKTIRRQML